MRFKVTMGVCWEHHAWQELGPYTVEAFSEEDAEVNAAQMADDDIQAHAPNGFTAVHLFMLSAEPIEEEEDGDSSTG